MPTYKLTYFNARGRAEIVRLIFAVAGVPYEDIRLEKDEWQAIKPNTPFGQIPVLEVDGVKYCQSNSCARYLAKQFKLAGKTELDELRVDMIVDCIEDIIKPAIKVKQETDDLKKAELKKTLEEEIYPKMLQHLEAILCANNNGDGYFVGDELTWADLVWYGRSSFFKTAGEIDFSAYPKLQALVKRVNSIPEIANWIAKRPVTAM